MMYQHATEEIPSLERISAPLWLIDSKVLGPALFHNLVFLSVEVLLPAFAQDVVTRDLCHNRAETVDKHCAGAAGGR